MLHSGPARATPRHLATHTSGIEDAELAVDDPAYSAHHMELPGWKGIFWRGTSDKHAVDGEADPFTVARDSAPVLPTGQYRPLQQPGHCHALPLYYGCIARYTHSRCSHVVTPASPRTPGIARKRGLQHRLRTHMGCRWPAPRRQLGWRWFHPTGNSTSWATSGTGWRHDLARLRRQRYLLRTSCEVDPICLAHNGLTMG